MLKKVRRIEPRGAPWEWRPKEEAGRPTGCLGPLVAWTQTLLDQAATDSDRVSRLNRAVLLDGNLSRLTVDYSDDLDAAIGTTVGVPAGERDRPVAPSCPASRHTSWVRPRVPAHRRWPPSAR